MSVSPSQKQGGSSNSIFFYQNAEKLGLKEIRLINEDILEDHESNSSVSNSPEVKKARMNLKYERIK
jgi:hypothetical protein